MTLTSYDVEITDLGEEPLRVIQLVSQINQWTLPQAHTFLQGCPRCIREDISHDQALDMQAQLECVGAVVRIRMY